MRARFLDRHLAKKHRALHTKLRRRLAKLRRQARTAARTQMKGILNAMNERLRTERARRTEDIQALEAEQMTLREDLAVYLFSSQRSIARYA